MHILNTYQCFLQLHGHTGSVSMHICCSWTVKSTTGSSSTAANSVKVALRVEWRDYLCRTSSVLTWKWVKIKFKFNGSSRSRANYAQLTYGFNCMSQLRTWKLNVIYSLRRYFYVFSLMLKCSYIWKWINNLQLVDLWCVSEGWIDMVKNNRVLTLIQSVVYLFFSCEVNVIFRKQVRKITTEWNKEFRHTSLQKG